jgi:hypothetical protein
VSKYDLQWIGELGRRKRNRFKGSGRRVAEISREDFEKAKDDPAVEKFVDDVRREGEQLEKAGLIHS